MNPPFSTKEGSNNKKKSFVHHHCPCSRWVWTPPWRGEQSILGYYGFLTPTTISQTTPFIFWQPTPFVKNLTSSSHSHPENHSQSLSHLYLHSPSRCCGSFIVSQFMLEKDSWLWNNIHGVWKVSLSLWKLEWEEDFLCESESEKKRIMHFEGNPPLTNFQMNSNTTTASGPSLAKTYSFKLGLQINK